MLSSKVLSAGILAAHYKPASDHSLWPLRGVGPWGSDSQVAADVADDLRSECLQNRAALFWRASDRVA